jgi:hypothetical protein
MFIARLCAAYATCVVHGLQPFCGLTASTILAALVNA